MALHSIAKGSVVLSRMIRLAAANEMPARVLMAAVKAVPLGQTDGQRILLSLASLLPATVAKAKILEDEDLGNFVPGLALLSSRHETQYSRLFRS